MAEQKNMEITTPKERDILITVNVFPYSIGQYALKMPKRHILDIQKGIDRYNITIIEGERLYVYFENILIYHIQALIDQKSKPVKIKDLVISFIFEPTISYIP